MGVKEKNTGTTGTTVRQVQGASWRLLASFCSFVAMAARRGRCSTWNRCDRWDGYDRSRNELALAGLARRGNVPCGTEITGPL